MHAPKNPGEHYPNRNSLTPYTETTPQFDSESEDLLRAIEALSDWNDDKEVRKYSEGFGPLLAEELDIEDPLAIDRVLQCEAQFGWPTYEDSDIIQYPPKFEDDNEFAAALFMHSWEGGLNNFKNWIETTPIARDDIAAAMAAGGNLQNIVYGLHPALHRAYALLPGFMQSLHDAYAALLIKNDAEFMNSDMLSSRDGKVIREGAHKAYRVLGRLLTQADQRIMQNNPQAPAVTDARIELTT